MRILNVSLEKEYKLQGGELTCILADCPLDGEHPDWRRPAVVVIPGGGYWMVSNREGEPIAMQFLSRGFHAFVLTYKCRPDGVGYPEQLLEAASAVDYVRKHAEEFCVNPQEIFVVGFSAGGHLTANLAVEHGTVSVLAGQELDCKPTAVGLCYPVISTETGYTDTHENLLADYAPAEKAELLKKLNLDQSVTKDTPPAFIWGTAADELVPSQNALRYALALANHGISYELHIYPQGQHGLASCDGENCPPDFSCPPRCIHWLDDCAAFFRLFTAEDF